MNTSPRIAVIGGGPGGLLCARGLQLHGLAATVYDADASLEARDAGGTLDLHADTGQIALEEAGLLDRFTELARPESQAKRSLTPDGDVLAEYVPDEGETAAPEIDRGQLRALITESLDPGSVRWGHKLVAATPIGGGVHRLRFAGGATAEADLVVGADGTWSRVRPLVTDARPAYTGVSFLDVEYRDVAARHPEIAKTVGAGHLFAAGHGRAIIAQRTSGDRVRAYLAFRAEEDWAARAGVDLADADAVRRFLLAEFRDWAPSLRRLVTEPDSAYVDRPIHVLPAPLEWAPAPGVTLLGDAAHVMAPFGGFGVNLALLDGAELARALASGDTDALARYEATMFARSGPLAVGANKALDAFFADRERKATDIPDHHEEKQRWQEDGERYRQRRAAEGRWTLRFRTPAGERRAELVLRAEGERLTGSLDGEALTDSRVEDGSVRFGAVLPSPRPLRFRCTASVDGDELRGTAEAGRLSMPFTGVRRWR